MHSNTRNFEALKAHAIAHPEARWQFKTPRMKYWQTLSPGKAPNWNPANKYRVMPANYKPPTSKYPNIVSPKEMAKIKASYHNTMAKARAAKKKPVRVVTQSKQLELPLPQVDRWAAARAAKAAKRIATRIAERTAAKKSTVSIEELFRRNPSTPASAVAHSEDRELLSEAQRKLVAIIDIITGITKV